MTVMQFDSHRGWYNPRPDYATRPYRADAPLRATVYARTQEAPSRLPIEQECAFRLIDRARRGDAAAEAELRARNGKLTR